LLNQQLELQSLKRLECCFCFKCSSPPKRLLIGLAGSMLCLWHSN